MANDPSKSPAQPVTATPSPALVPVAGIPAAPGSTGPVTAAGSVPLFGGHRGGGKQRADGLLAGSEEAREADKKKDRERKASEYARKRTAALPPVLPAAGGLAVSPPVGAAGAVVDGGMPLPAVAAVAGPVVAWKVDFLEKPARLLMRIIDRFRQMDIFRRLDKSNLPPAVKDEIKADAAWKEEARNDFAGALAQCATVELNRRAVGAQNAHWINLTLSSGELALAHFTLCDRIDKLVLAASNTEAQSGKDEK